MLRYRLGILWGNLEEIRTAMTAERTAAVRSDDAGTDQKRNTELSNLPFECCIQEYGQELDSDDQIDADGWIRLYEISKTTILSD